MIASVLLSLGWLALGLVILYFGAEGTLKGAVSIARRMNISPLVIGLTLVAFGTSAPELSLDVTAALRGTTDLAFGDLIGSNLANIGLILGVSALIRPMRIQMRLLRIEIPIVIATALLVWALAIDGELSRQDGLFLLTALVLFLGYSFRSARQESEAVKEELREAATDLLPMRRSVVYVVLGLVGLVAGAQCMVHGAVDLARLIGVSELMIGLTIVAIGTSLPELATSIVASRRGEADIIAGNVVGSNIFNLLGILALVAAIRPLEIPTESLHVDVPVMVGFSLALVPIILRGMVISRREGAVMLSAYIAFLGWQVWTQLR